MVKEFKDVGKVIKTNTQETQNGIHFNNNAIPQLEKEWNDVESDAKKLKGTHWDAEYTNGWKDAVSNSQFKQMDAAHEQFKNSPAGMKLKKEVKELIGALKQNVKVTDLPKEEALDEEDNFDLEHEIEMLRISVTQAGANKIKQEGNDVEAAWKKIEHSQPVNNVKTRFSQWAQTPEVAKLKALDQKFLASAEGQRMIKEWKELAKELKQDVKVSQDKLSIYVNNNDIPKIQKEAMDVKQQYTGLKGTAWETAYKNGWEAAIKN